MRSCITIGVLLIEAATASGGLPPLGGAMNHVLVSLDASSTFALTVEREGPMELVEPDGDFTGPAGVLNGTRFNGQYGWLVSGLWAPPAGSSVRIEAVSVDEGLAFYAGRSFSGVPFMDPIHGTAGSDAGFAWDGGMLHNYAAATAPGVYAAVFRVSIVDGAGEPLPGYGAGEIALTWSWTPECPADLAQPFGVLDLSDITAFVSAFLVRESIADLALPVGVFDLNDIVGFVDAFIAGCP
jgi:hypothetical protein